MQQKWAKNLYFPVSKMLEKLSPCLKVYSLCLQVSQQLIIKIGVMLFFKMEAFGTRLHQENRHPECAYFHSGAN